MIGDAYVGRQGGGRVGVDSRQEAGQARAVGQVPVIRSGERDGQPGIRRAEGASGLSVRVISFRPAPSNKSNSGPKRAPPVNVARVCQKARINLAEMIEVRKR